MSVLAILPFVAAAGHPVWYGPASVTFDYAAPGNPYDAVLNDVNVLFSGPGGRVEKRPAYFADGKWSAWLVAQTPGAYTARLERNGRELNLPPASVRVTTAIKEGFVRVGPGQSFRFESGARYWPLGHNLAWYSPSRMRPIPDALKEMADAGVNWSRIWACTWDGKNPWWPSEKQTVPIGELWPPALDQWGDVVAGAERADVRFQFVLFHHGEFSSTTDANWSENPWNEKNGGFLKDPVDFFTNPRAKQLSRNWLRYAVARYGHSPSVMAWELFNEVQWVDAVKKGHIDDVVAWHDEMAHYLRSIDPYHHLVTTSSDLNLPIWKTMDFYSPHGYPPSVAALVLATDAPKDKPLFYGEIGPGDLGGPKPVQRKAVRDGIWSGLFAQHAGAAEYWTWDAVFPYGLLDEYRIASKIIGSTRVLDEKRLSRLSATVDAGQGGDLSLAPGGGWEAARQLEYELPRDANQLGKLPSYFQGVGHREMRTGPVVFRFHAPSAGQFTARMIGISSGGAHLVVAVNGEKAAEKTWASGARPDSVAVPFPAGDVVVSLENDGPDWFQLGEIVVTGIAPRVSVVAIGNGRMVLARVQRSDQRETPTASVAGLPLRDGEYDAELTDLDSGVAQELKIRLSKGAIVGGLPVAAQDSILAIRHGKGRR